MSEGNTVNAQLENMILKVRNYDDEMSRHRKLYLLSHKKRAKAYMHENRPLVLKVYQISCEKRPF